MASESTAPRSPLLDARRRRTQTDIADAALRLFTSRGLESTTAEDIAVDAGISLRTFYRYCNGKEDALTFVVRDGLDDLFSRMTAADPRLELKEVLLQALLDSANESNEGGNLREYVVAMSRMPGLRMRWLGAAREAQEQLAPIIAERLGPGVPMFEVDVIAGMLVSLMTTTVEHWSSGDESFETLAQRAVAQLPHLDLGDVAQRAMSA